MPSTTDQVKFVLLFLILALVIVILILILVNGVRRTFCSKPENEDGLHERCVDFYVTNVDRLQTLTGVLLGMTALLDKGVTNLETGIYMYQRVDDVSNVSEWMKIAMPEEGEKYRILRGDAASQRYTIRRTFLNDVRPPTETQVIDNAALVQNLKEDTSVVYVAPSITSNATVNVSVVPNSQSEHNGLKLSASLAIGRQVVIHNTSPTFLLTLCVGNKEVRIAPMTTRIVYLNADRQDPNQNYTLGTTF